MVVETQILELDSRGKTRRLAEERVRAVCLIARGSLLVDPRLASCLSKVAFQEVCHVE